MAKCESDNLMVPIDRAYELVDRMRGQFYAALPSETIPAGKSLGRRLSTDVTATVSSPAHHISTMDGYAVRASDVYPLRLMGEIYAGDGTARALGAGEAAYITTGAIVPDGADAVLKIEEAVAKDGMLYGTGLEPWTNIIKAGSDFLKGETILIKNMIVTPSAIGILCAAAVDSVQVYCKIKAAVLSSGDEIKNGLTRDTNAPMACAMLQTWGCEAVHLGVIPDDPDETVAMLDMAASGFDVVVTIGGVSVGKKDFIASTIMGGGRVVFQGYRIRPGKPLLVSYYRDVPFFSLPGKPTGSFTAMELIVRRFILGEPIFATMNVPLIRDIELHSKGFDYVVYVQLKDGNAVPMGYEESPLKLFAGARYGVSIVSSSPRSVVADGFFITRDDVKAGQDVTVNML